MPAVHSKSFATGAEIAGIDPGHGAGDRDSDGGEKLMNSRVFLALMIVALATACARPGRELKAPCGPISSYAANDACGELKPANSAFDKVASE
ncbi:MAG: hypothetical protein E5X84_00735 [Mesorhizobium sp.]|nr:MAG: hypothetical protein E5X84_00735 [Mesorhizobium sp.]